jgi:hypothetical protein
MDEDEAEEEGGGEEAEEDIEESSHSEEETENDEIIKTEAGEEGTIVEKEKPLASPLKQGRKRKQRSAEGKTEIGAVTEEEEWEAPTRRLCIDLDALRKAHARDAPAFLDAGLPSPRLVGLVAAQWTSRKDVNSEVCRDILCTLPLNLLLTYLNLCHLLHTLSCSYSPLRSCRLHLKMVRSTCCRHRESGHRPPSGRGTNCIC